MLLRDVLNRIRWRPSERQRKFSVVITDRMTGEGIRTIEAASITEVHATYFLCDENEELKHIPLHHVVRVFDQDGGEVLWEKRSRQAK